MTKPSINIQLIEATHLYDYTQFSRNTISDWEIITPNVSEIPTIKFISTPTNLIIIANDDLDWTPISNEDNKINCNSAPVEINNNYF